MQTVSTVQFQVSGSGFRVPYLLLSVSSLSRLGEELQVAGYKLQVAGHRLQAWVGKR